ncbi:MAG TPA: 4-alpha-glucanotransferase, partial [Acidimicrobiia bacterium]|nr:4-alpha-glucanotransferase [Acidimicrobiia bacterium]
ALDRVAESDAARYHAYVQWLCTLQVANLGRTLRLYDVDLLLDLPLGTHAQGYDVWRRRDAFVEGVSMGAPPDGFFTGGQTWGLAPLHPERARADGHAYWRRCLAFQMEVADALRIDHVMGLHRLFWVPDGFPPTEGVYVRNHADELYALLCLESQRHGCRVVGEDLGTVPPEVREEMARRDVARTVVAQFELPGSAGDAASSPPVASLATMNTHDTPPFLRYWEAGDVDDRVEHGWLDPEEAEAERAGRRRSLEATAGWLEKAGYLAPGAPHGAGEVLAGLLAWLGASRAEMAVATLEDLWLEDQPQNVPGTGAERGNWSRRTREPLEAWTADPAAQRRLLALFREDAHGGDGSE